MTENEARGKLIWFNKIRKELIDESPNAIPSYFDEVEYKEFTESIELAILALEEIHKYHSIGTVSECRDAMDRREAKSPVMKPKNQSPHYENDTKIFCPTCNKRLRVKYKERFCCGCGQKLDWSNA